MGEAKYIYFTCLNFIKFPLPKALSSTMGPDIGRQNEHPMSENGGESEIQNGPHSERDIVNIGEVLNSPSTPLADRFRALFTLKNLGGPTAIEAIGRGIGCYWRRSGFGRSEETFEGPCSRSRRNLRVGRRKNRVVKETARR